MYKNYVSFVFFIGVICLYFFSCGEGSNATYEPNSSIDSVKSETDLVQFFLDGHLQSGSLTVFYKDAELFSDSLLKKKLPYQPRFGDTLKVLGKHGALMEYDTKRSVLEVEFMKDKIPMRVYVNENSLVQKIIPFGGVDIFICFDKKEPSKGLQPFVMLFVEKSLRIKQQENFLAAGFDIFGDLSYSHDIYAEKVLSCDSANPVPQLLSIFFSKSACGYHNSEIKVLYQNDKFFLSEELGSCNEAGVFSYGEQLYYSCKNNGTYIYTYKQTENEEDSVFCDSVAIQCDFNMKTGWLKKDTIGRRQWKCIE